MSKKWFFCSAALTVMAAATSSAAWAQAGSAVSHDSAETTLGEVIVTARKTTENLQKAPATIVAVGEEELEQRGIANAQELEKVLPSVNLRQQGAITQVYIRGVGARVDSPNFPPGSAFVFNDLVIPRFGTFGLLYDIGSVQAIAGPQGTLYGGSAAGGAINLYSAKPTNDNSGSAELEGGSYKYARGSLTQNIALSDNVGLRGSIEYNRRDSYYNIHLGTQSLLRGRLSLLAKPTDDLTVHLHYSAVLDTGRPITSSVAFPFVFPDDPWRLPVLGPRGNAIDPNLTRQDFQSQIIGANVEWRAGDNVFTYIPGLVRFSADYEYYSGGAGFLLQIYDREAQHTQELRWNRTIGDFQLSGGLFYLRNEIDYNVSQFRYATATTGARVPLALTNQVNTSYAVYGQAVYSVTDRLRLTAGARISYDKVVADGLGAYASPIAPFAYRNSHTQPDYKVGIDYDLTPKILVYANVQTSYIPFGFNPDVNPAATIKQSELFAISGGVKSRFLDDRLEVNAEAFHYDYKDFQAIIFNTTTGLSTALAADKSTIYGLDVSLRAILPYNTVFNAGLVLQSAKYDVLRGAGFDFSGNRMIDAPKVNLIAGLQHTMDLGDQGELVARIDTHYEGGKFHNFNNFPFTNDGSYTKTDVSLTYKPENARWKLQGYVRNLEDNAVFSSLGSGATPTTPSAGGLMAPRTWGVQLSVNWN